MRKAFTLVEMLIVVVVLITLMSITFRLSSVGEDQTDTAETISRLQRLENCLSGYYAAFGTYPPVKDHGVREFREIKPNGLQTDTKYTLNLNWYKADGDHGISTTTAKRDWYAVEAVCRVQPVAAMTLEPDGCYEAQEQLAALQGVTMSFDDRYTKNPGRDLERIKSFSDWRQYQLFQFGLMSFLLPRLPLMMTASSAASEIFKNSRQWTDNNSLPCNQLDGTVGAWGWDDILSAMSDLNKSGTLSGSTYRDVGRSVLFSPSHAPCARWLPNLQNLCYVRTGSEYRFYGVNITSEDDELEREGKESYGDYDGGDTGSSSLSNPWSLNIITVVDAWGTEFFYYSPPPYQSYQLWSAGRNQRTFPPWIEPETSQAKSVAAWTEDDIVNMSH